MVPVPLYIYIVSNPNMSRSLQASIRKSNRLGGVAYCVLIAIVVLYLIPDIVLLILSHSQKAYTISNLVAFAVAAYVIPFRVMMKIDSLLIVTDRRIITLDKRWLKALKPRKGNEALSMHAQRFSDIRSIMSVHGARRDEKIRAAEMYLETVVKRAEPPAVQM